MTSETDVAAPVTPCSAMMFFVAETPLHAGAESSGGVIDLPIQREAHTAWPCVFSSSVKGAWREHACKPGRMPDEDERNAVFGHEGAQFGGALAVGDLTILALPVRSLNSHFKWVTCNAVLRRFAAAAQRIGFAGAPADIPAKPGDAVGGLPRAWLACGPNGRLVLEEFAFVGEVEATTTSWSGKIDTWTGLKTGLAGNGLVVVPDDEFRWFAEHATPVAPHVKLTDKKGVKFGPWYEETLPIDSILYAAVECRDARDEGTSLKGAQVLQKAKGALPQYLRVGGNESLGMGWGRVLFEDAR